MAACDSDMDCFVLWCGRIAVCDSDRDFCVVMRQDSSVWQLHGLFCVVIDSSVWQRRGLFCVVMRQDSSVWQWHGLFCVVVQQDSSVWQWYGLFCVGWVEHRPAPASHKQNLSELLFLDLISVVLQTYLLSFFLCVLSFLLALTGITLLNRARGLCPEVTLCGWWGVQIQELTN